ncbi:MAG TPA: ribosome maturation factor RimM [Nitriliruptorales bacterium]
MRNDQPERPAGDGGRRLVGRVVKPHGIRGEVAIEPLTDLGRRWEPGSVLHGQHRRWTVESGRAHQGRVLVKFQEVADRNAAELLRGLELHGDPLDTAEYDTYFVHELVGMQVVDEDSNLLGEVSGVIELPEAAGYDLLEVTREDGTSFLLPDVDELVGVGTDDEGGEYLVVTDPPEGLLPDQAVADVVQDTP